MDKPEYLLSPSGEWWGAVRNVCGKDCLVRIEEEKYGDTEFTYMQRIEAAKKKEGATIEALTARVAELEDERTALISWHFKFWSWLQRIAYPAEGAGLSAFWSVVDDVRKHDHALNPILHLCAGLQAVSALSTEEQST